MTAFMLGLMADLIALSLVIFLKFKLFFPMDKRQVAGPKTVVKIIPHQSITCGCSNLSWEIITLMSYLGVEKTVVTQELF